MCLNNKKLLSLPLLRWCFIKQGIIPLRKSEIILRRGFHFTFLYWYLIEWWFYGTPYSLLIIVIISSHFWFGVHYSETRR